MSKNNQYKNILVTLLANLGDVVLSTATLKLIKKKYPHAKIFFLVRSQLADILQNNPYIDEVIPFSYKSGGNFISTFQLARKLRKYNFDLSISLCGRFRSDFSIWLARIPIRVGADQIWSFKKNCSFLYTNVSKINFSYQTPTYILFQNIFKYFEKEYNDTKKITPYIANAPEFFFYKANNFIESMNSDKINIALCVKATSENKNWDIENFANIISLLKKNYNPNMYIVGTKEDKEYASNIISKANVDVKNFCGKTSLLELVAIIQQSSFLLTVDNGTMHIASALNTPIICIYTGTSPLTAPPLSDISFSTGLDRLSEYELLEQNHRIKITVQEVFTLCEKMISLTKKKG